MLTDFAEIWCLVFNLTSQCWRRISLKSDIVCQSYGNVYRGTVFSWTRCIIILRLFWILSGTTWVSRYQKGKNEEGETNLDLLEQEIVSRNGICWAICKSAPQTGNHANIPPLSFLQAGCPSCHPTNSIRALKNGHPERINIPNADNIKLVTVNN